MPQDKSLDIPEQNEATAIAHAQSAAETVAADPAAFQWFVLRDLKRSNAKLPAYKQLAEMGVEVFTPMRWVSAVVRGKRKRKQVPALSDLLFAHSERSLLDPIIDVIPTLQYRFVRGAYCKPLVVRDSEMQSFIRATTQAADPHIYTLEEMARLSVGKEVRILGGALDGVVGKVVNVRGARKKRVLVSIPDLIAAVVEVEPEFVEILD